MLEGRELEAAAAAARLKAFRADPMRFGPRYLDGAEPIPDAAFVLRFAQGKVPAHLTADAAELRLAAEEFVRRVCLADRSDHYLALCARRDAAPDTIKANYHLLMALLHPDRQEGGADAWPESCAQRVNLAYATLGDELTRRQYDSRLRSERPRAHASADAARRIARRRANEVRFAKGLIVVSAVVAALVVIGLVVEDDQWGDRSVLHAAFARIGPHPVPGADRPRYVGATAMAPRQRASDAGADEGEPFSIFKPLMRVLVADDPKPWVAPVRIEAPEAKPAQAAPVEHAERGPLESRPPEIAPAPVAAPAAPVQLAQAASVPVAMPRVALESEAPTNQEIEGVVVALIAYYEAGDAERLFSLIDPASSGLWRTARMREAYSEFFRTTRVRRLRVERLAWNASAGTARAKGEATVQAEYFDRPSPVDRRVDVELDIVVRDGQPRIARLSLFPGAR